MKIRITFEGTKKTCMDVLFYLGIISLTQFGFVRPFIFTDDSISISFVKEYMLPLLTVLCICMSIVSIVMQFADDE